ncbi:MAG: hypothetical protein C5B52_00070 [Bacteroidetes bacterium]|nr:MAG: hypothetical protein C5B52_00070 [Bacteroidota bacterium]
MKALFLHTFYYEKGGEDVVFNAERDLLKGVAEIETLTFKNLTGIKGAFSLFFSIWNLAAAKKIRRKIQQFRPDVVHIHNWHFGMGPIAIRVARKMGVPVVVTLHNYRLMCPSATFYGREGIQLKSMEQEFPWSAIRQGMYRNSIVLTFWLSFVNWFHARIGTFAKVNRFIVQTDFAKTVFAGNFLGIDPKNIIVKPNFIPDIPENGVERISEFLFVGRLSKEKGISIMLEAFSKTNLPLSIIGEGPLRNEVEKYCRHHTNISYSGFRDRDYIYFSMKRASALVFPSVWFEGMPITILEAFANGTPVIASNLGAMSTMITDNYNGIHFTASNADSLSDALNRWNNFSVQERMQLSSNARNTYLEKYSPEKNRYQLLEIYRDIMTSNNTHLLAPIKSPTTKETPAVELA